MTDCGFTSCSQDPPGGEVLCPTCGNQSNREYGLPCSDCEDAPESAQTPAGGSPDTEGSKAAERASCALCGGTGWTSTAIAFGLALDPATAGNRAPCPDCEEDASV